MKTFFAFSIDDMGRRFPEFPTICRVKLVKASGITEAKRIVLERFPGKWALFPKTKVDAAIIGTIPAQEKASTP